MLSAYRQTIPIHRQHITEALIRPKYNCGGLKMNLEKYDLVSKSHQYWFVALLLQMWI